MKRLTFGLGVMIAGLALAATPALAQRPNDSSAPRGGGGAVSGARSGGGGGGGMAVPRGGGGAPASSASAGSAPSSSMSSPSAPSAMAPSMRSAGSAAPRQAAPSHRNTGSQGTAQGRFTGTQHTANSYAIPRNGGATTSGNGARTPVNPDTRAVPSWARTRPGGGANATSDSAVGRTTPRPQPGNRLAYYYYPGYANCFNCGLLYGNYYDPFYGDVYSPFVGYGMGLGLGGYPIFDPSFGYASGGDEYNYGVGSYSTSQYGSHEEGNLKLKVKPRSAKVYVDGYFVGVVDEFDGTFQKLPLTAGRHHVKIEADGYQTDEFDAVITADQTVTFQGTLKKVQ